MLCRLHSHRMALSCRPFQLETKLMSNPSHLGALAHDWIRQRLPLACFDSLWHDPTVSAPSCACWVDITHNSHSNHLECLTGFDFIGQTQACPCSTHLMSSPLSPAVELSEFSELTGQIRELTVELNSIGHSIQSQLFPSTSRS